ncbi:MAG: hypothetical protein GX662_05790 [Trichococcus flocculiformis]|uniref:Uncharacterized protein n=2 Tax=Trichococcus flocculiformis TaxID=82803 RepID=A0A847D5K8_9LACT|nr:hypothetical protein [Trichococcus flocculiformis]
MNNERARIPDGVQARFFGMSGKLLPAPAKQASPEKRIMLSSPTPMRQSSPELAHSGLDYSNHRTGTLSKL